MRVHKGVFYFRERCAAESYARAHDLPTDRIIEYLLGFAIQLRISGPYAGPSESHTVTAPSLPPCTNYRDYQMRPLDALDAAEVQIRATMPDGDAKNRALDLVDIARGEVTPCA